MPKSRRISMNFLRKFSQKWRKIWRSRGDERNGEFRRAFAGKHVREVPARRRRGASSANAEQPLVQRTADLRRIVASDGLSRSLLPAVRNGRLQQGRLLQFPPPEADFTRFAPPTAQPPPGRRRSSAPTHFHSSRGAIAES